MSFMKMKLGGIKSSLEWKLKLEVHRGLYTQMLMVLQYQNATQLIVHKIERKMAKIMDQLLELLLN